MKPNWLLHITWSQNVASPSPPIGRCDKQNILDEGYLTEAEFLYKIQTKFFRVFILATIHSLLYCTALPWDLYFFKLTQPLKVSIFYLLYTMKEKDRKPYPRPFGLRNP
jgi:hypothetical protein